MNAFADFVGWINGLTWGWPMIVLLVGTGIYLTIRLGFLQFRYLSHSIRIISGKFDDPEEKGDISHFQALAAALSATIGTGNIAGVATAISLGGPGAVFWMWVTALIGMATKYTSCSLALKYRRLNPDGSVSGGPMYFLAKGLKRPWLGGIFALFAGLASFGIGCAVQSNSVIDGLRQAFPSSLWDYKVEVVPLISGTSYLSLALGAMLAFVVGMVIIGGIRRIAKVASYIVPWMCLIYVSGAMLILLLNLTRLPAALGQIFQFAFTPYAATGGFIGVVIQQSMRFGVARGVFSNESGLGSAPIAHAAAKTKEMAREGFVAMIGPFIDTILICSMTALVILSTGAWEVRAPDGAVLHGPGGNGYYERINGKRMVTAQTTKEGAQEDYFEIPTGASLTATAFEHSLPYVGHLIVALGLVFFAFSTIIAWSYYGDRSWEYLLGARAVMPYRILYCITVVIGACAGLDLVWNIADTLNALMAIPNLIGLLLLAHVVAAETQDYLKRMKSEGKL